MNRAAIIFLCLLAGGVIIRYFILTESIESFADGDNIRFEARLLATPQEERNIQKFSLMPPGYEELRIVTGKYPRYHYGEKLQVEGTVKRSTLENGVVLTTSYFPVITQKDDDSILFNLTRFIRERVSEAFSAFLPPTSSSLLLGIVFGVKEGLPEDFEIHLQTTGVFHVIAASGMNVSMLSGFLMALSSRFFRRQVALVLCILSIAFYTILAGLEPSIIRASIMATIAFSALFLGRQATALWSLTLTALVMLLADPFLLSDIGFQLSFAATMGILLIKPHLSWKKKASSQQGNESLPVLALLSEDVGSTISAQIATIPIMLFYFHQYGLLSILVNALVLWTIPPLMVIGSLSAAVALAIPSVAGLLSLIGLPFLWLFEVVVKVLSPFNPVLEVGKFSFFFVLSYYLLLLSGLLFLKQRKEAKN